METIEFKEMLLPKTKLWTFLGVAFVLLGVGIWSYIATYRGYVDSDYLMESWPAVKWALYCFVGAGFWYWHIRSKTYRLTPDGVEAEKGLWWTHIATIPYSQIRQVTILQSIEGRYFDYGRIDVEFSGSYGEKSDNRIRMRSIKHPRAIKAEIEKRMRG